MTLEISFNIQRWHHERANLITVFKSILNLKNKLTDIECSR
jgi:hypothetical protein